MSLYPRLFGTVVFPSLDRLNKTHVWKTYRHLDESQWWPLERHLKAQASELEELSRYTRESSEFYREHWRNAPDTRRASSHHAELDGLPVVTKEDLRAASAQFPLRGWEGRTIVTKTSGSTGHPMTFHRTREQESWFWALRMRMWSWGGYVPGEPYLTLNLNARNAWKKRLQDVLFRCWYHGFNANDNDVEAVIRDLTKNKIPHLVGYSSSLYLLARALEERGLGNPGVRSILATGDTLFPPYRAKIEEVFGVSVVDYYGAGGEGIHLASQCERAERYHLHLEDAVFEILKDGRPAQPGEMGEIVITQLHNRAMPLVRYATQDVAIAGDDAICPCGRELPLIDGIQGRVPDIVTAPDGTALVVHYFTILFEHLDGIGQFQVVQEKPDALLVRLVSTDPKLMGANEQSIQRQISEVTHGTLDVSFEYTDEIPLAPSGKRRLVVSEVHPPERSPGSSLGAQAARAVEAVPAEVVHGD